MNDRQRVVWFEGMTLDPHHFQQWDRYQHSVAHGRTRALHRHDWGFTHLELDRDRLANGELALIRARGMMSDGLLFDIPDRDAAPEPRSVQEHFPPSAEQVGVYLSVPTEKHNGSNIVRQGGNHRSDARYGAEAVTVYDENTGVDERQIEVAKARFHLRFETENLSAFTALQVGAIKRTSGGAFELDERYVPTTLTVRASDRLVALARRILELLVSRSGALAERREAAAAQRELSPGDVTALMLLSAVNTYIPQVNHHFKGAGSHPEQLYLTLLALAGQLAAVVQRVPVQPREFPVYDHSDLSGCFNRLDSILTEMLGGAAPPSNYSQIPLKQQRENLYVGNLDARVLEHARLFLVTRSDEMQESRIVAELPKMLRIASPATIDAVLRSYTRALTIEHTHRLPVGMPVDQRASYFQLQKRGPFWESIQETGAVAIFIPREFTSVDIKLIAVEEPS